jgi:hypothetical protein
MSEAMTIEQAKSLSGALMRVMFARQGLGDVSNDLFEKVQSASLIDLLTANAMMVGYKESLEAGGTRCFVHTTDFAIAELYCRLQQPDFKTVDDVIDLADGYEQFKEGSRNGFAVLIDSYGHSTLIELNHDGNGGEEIQSEGTFLELYSWVKKQVNS